ncbi:hypothetical protein RND81_02G008600 [Saponaria officinalis]|uniref:Pectinesterase inhibitor domain-containing protein n=1 Tax=Saponaria officinalis TaxID=3572 RepID=A0AAW1MU68_SAPOF
MTPHQNIIIIAALLCASVAVQAANPTLITRLCGETSAPEACTRCIKSQPPPPKNEQDVVFSLLYCAYLDTQLLETDTKNAIDSESTDQTTRSALDQCNSLIINLISENGILKFKVRKKEYSQAKSDVDGYINNEIKGCSKLLGATGVKIPPKVFSGLFSMTSDYGITSQVLGLVH